jgi:hypothetical protein
MDLYIDKLVTHSTYQSGTWLFCFEATADGVKGRYHVKDYEYEGDETTINMDLKLANVRVDQVCSFFCHLDDDEDDVCGGKAEDKSTGDFTTTANDTNPNGSSKRFKFRNGDQRWEYTVYWHMK